MNKLVALTLILISLTALCIIFTEPATAANENSWTEKAPIPTEREGFGVATVNGKIYVIGGHIFSNANEMYDPASNTWTTLTPMPTGRLNFGIAVYQNKIYVIGGQNTSYAIPGPYFVDYEAAGVTGVNEVYDPATDTWEIKTSMPTARNYLQANVVEGKIYLIGGLCQQKLEYPLTNHASNVTEVYNPINDTWTTAASMPTTVWSYASAVTNEKIYITSGWTGSSSSRWGVDSSLSNQTQIFNPKTNDWSLGAPIPIPVTLAAAGATTGEMALKRIYVIGGCLIANTQEQPGIQATQIYDPATDTWSSGAKMPIGRKGLGVAVANDMLYAMGGASISLINANEQYTPIGYGTPDPTYQTPTASPTQSFSPSPTQSPTVSSTLSPTVSPTPSIPEFPPWIILTLLAIASATFIVLGKRVKK